MSTTTTLTTAANSKGRDIDPLQAEDSSAENAFTNSTAVLGNGQDEIRPSDWYTFVVHWMRWPNCRSEAFELAELVDTESFWDDESVLLAKPRYARVLGLSDVEARQRLAYRLAKNGASPLVVAIAISGWETPGDFQNDLLDKNSLHRRYCDRVVIQSFHQLYLEDEWSGRLRRPLTSEDYYRLSDLLGDEMSGKGPARYWR